MIVLVAIFFLLNEHVKTPSSLFPAEPLPLFFVGTAQSGYLL
jgi:hypothetical protein